MRKRILANLAPWLWVILSILIIAGCNTQEKKDYLSLTGESNNWNLTGYEIEITPKEFKAGNGSLSMKSQNEYITNYFHYETHIVVSKEDITIQTGSASGEANNIAEQTIGTIKGGTYLNKKHDPITCNDISDVYMIVEWWDASKNENVAERLDLSPS